MPSNANRQAQRDIRRAKGLCLTLYCKRKAMPNRVRCFDCAVKHAALRMRAYHRHHKRESAPPHSEGSPD